MWAPRTSLRALLSARDKAQERHQSHARVRRWPATLQCHESPLLFLHNVPAHWSSYPPNLTPGTHSVTRVTRITGPQAQEVTRASAVRFGRGSWAPESILSSSQAHDDLLPADAGEEHFQVLCVRTDKTEAQTRSAPVFLAC